MKIKKNIKKTLFKRDVTDSLKLSIFCFSNNLPWTVIESL